MTKIFISFLWSIKERIRNSKISYFSYFDKESHISNKASLGRFVIFKNSSINDFSYIGPNSSIMNTEIGKYCSISKNVNIGLPTHPINFISTSPIFFSNSNATGYHWREDKVFEDMPKKVVIGNDVWIGLNVSILGGVKIGDGAIIGSHALVTKDVEPYTIVGGVPAKLIRKRFPDLTAQMLLKLGWWNKPEELLKKNIDLFVLDIDQNTLDILGDKIK